MAETDWEISELYKKSWDIVKNNKMLWVLGAASAASFSSGGSGGGSSNSSPINNNSETVSSLFPSTQNIPQVLGTTTDSNPLFNVFNQVFSLIPPGFFILMIFEILLLFAVFIIIGLIYSAWSEAALLQGIRLGINNTKVTIEETSTNAFSSIKSLIWLNTIPILSIILTGAAALIISVILIGLESTRIIGIILTIVLVISFIVALIYTTLSLIWASRLVVYKKLPAKQAFFNGLKITRKKKWPMILLGFINVVLSFLVVVVPAGIVFGVFLGGFLNLSSNQSLAFSLFGIGGLLVIALIIGLSVISGILNAFKASVWTLAYDSIKGKYDV